MKTIGIVGGIGPESTVDYYRLILVGFAARNTPALPGILINSIDLKKGLALVTADDRVGLTDYLVEAVEVLDRAGVDFGLFAANTPHLVFDEVQARVKVPLVSIVEATAEAALAQSFKRVGLLGTRFTMGNSFYPVTFARRGIEVVSPTPDEQAWIHDKYINELLKNEFKDGTRDGFAAIIRTLIERHGIDALVLGGTELPLLLRGVTLPLPVLDTTVIHVDAVVERALG